MKFGYFILFYIVLIMLVSCVSTPSPPASPPRPSASPSEPVPPTPVPTPTTPAPSPNTVNKENDVVDIVPASVTYEIEFVADWSEKTHPKDYPSGAHFSPFVAYSHNDLVDSLIFITGQKPTPGIEQIAERGSTTTLNQEIDKLISSNLAFKRTGGKLINSPGTVTSELEFTKDYSHMTFVSMIAPSPDWFVSQTINTLKDGKWIDNIELTLITYDAGSDSGMTLTSQDIDTQPKEPITVFSDNLQRLGKLILTKIR